MRVDDTEDPQRWRSDGRVGGDGGGRREEGGGRRGRGEQGEPQEDEVIR